MSYVSLYLLPQNCYSRTDERTRSGCVMNFLSSHSSANAVTTELLWWRQLIHEEESVSLTSVCSVELVIHSALGTPLKTNQMT